MINRRSFFQVLLGTLAVTTGEKILAAEGKTTHLPKDFTFSSDAFNSLKGESFTLNHEGKTVTFILNAVEISSDKNSPMLDSFRLNFDIEVSESDLPGGIYTLTNSRFGTHDLYLNFYSTENKKTASADFCLLREKS